MTAWAERHFYIEDTEAPIVLAPHQKAVLRHCLTRNAQGRLPFKTVIWSEPKKGGKALALDTRLVTPSGWTTMGNITVGDSLFDEAGNICTVTHATNVMYEKECYAVTFSDGAVIVADAEHLWQVETLSKDYRLEVKTTREMADSVVMRADGARNYRVAVAASLRTRLSDLPISPYVLGAWLGDGASAVGRITCSEQEILDSIQRTETIHLIPQEDRAPTYAISPQPRGGSPARRATTLTARLRHLGVLNNKHIPMTYLRACNADRLDLLQGLMDTDGSIVEPIGTTGGKCEYTTTNPVLGQDVQELIRTLGLKPRMARGDAILNGRSCGPKYRITFHAPSSRVVFRLARKRARQRPRTERRLRSEARHIVSIVRVPSVPVRCIQVDSPSQLYLAGDSMIPTHNTTVAGLVTRWAAESWGRFGEILCVGNDVDQARERGFAKLRQSIELTPGYRRSKETLPDRWKLTTKEALCLTTGTRVKAIATDYQGEAGANPTLSVWTELWGFIHKADLRFWGELAPSPTRPDSIRWVESYAGFEGESELLYNLYKAAVLDGHQLTAGELGDLDAFQEAPNADSPVPCYVNEPASIFAYWDEGEAAHRQPWQQGDHGAEYYASEASTQTPAQFTRIHRNQWVSAESSFIEIEWWDSCPWTTGPMLPGDRTPVVLALDAAVSGDCFGLVGVTRMGAQVPEEPVDIAIRFVRKWDPPPGGSINYAGPEAAVRELCKAFNVVEVAYDPYQLHHFATRLQGEGVAWFRPFSQGEERLRSDKGLYDMVVHRRIHHDGHPDLREHLTNANAKQQPSEDSKLRLVKKASTRKVDLAVCLSMANAECQRLNL